MSSDASAARLEDQCSGTEPRARDTHSIVAAAQLLLQVLDGWQARHPGSLISFWCPVQRAGTGRELGQAQAASSLLSGSSARQLPTAAGAPLPSWGEVFPRPAAPGASPRLTPAVCPPTAPSAPGSCGKRGELASGPAAPNPWGLHSRAQPCPVEKDTGAGPSPVGQDRGAAQALAASVLTQQLLLPFPSGHQQVTRARRT